MYNGTITPRWHPTLSPSSKSASSLLSLSSCSQREPSTNMATKWIIFSNEVIFDLSSARAVKESSSSSASPPLLCRWSKSHDQSHMIKSADNKRNNNETWFAALWPVQNSKSQIQILWTIIWHGWSQLFRNAEWHFHLSAISIYQSWSHMTRTANTCQPIRLFSLICAQNQIQG